MFANKTAIITGASRGIGLSIAEAFAKQGASTLLIGRNRSRMEEVEERFRKNFGDQDHRGILMDVSDKEQVDSILKMELKDRQVHYLINAAGMSKDALLVKLRYEDLEDTMNTNLLGTIRVSQHVAKSMLKWRQGGCIINISSVVGERGNIGQSAYSASKAGIIGFTKSLAKELGPSQIRVNAIAPGFIHTDMTQDIPDEKKLKIIENIPLRRFGHVNDVSLAALFIAQSEYIHGQVLNIDGGIVL